MIRLYEGGGSGEIQLLGQLMSERDWAKLRHHVCRLLKARKSAVAANLLESIPFDLVEGTNGFGDEFSVLYLLAPLEQYLQLAERSEKDRDRLAFRQIAETVTEVSPYYIRFIAVDLDTSTGPIPVESPSLRITSDTVERALSDAEKLIHTQGAVSGVDRVHTAFHGYLKEVCLKSGIDVTEEANITQLFKLIRENHPKFLKAGPRAGDIDKIVRAMANIVDALNPVRNQASIVHPNRILLEEPEAMLVINVIRTLLHYLDKKIL